MKTEKSYLTVMVDGDPQTSTVRITVGNEEISSPHVFQQIEDIRRSKDVVTVDDETFRSEIREAAGERRNHSGSGSREAEKWAKVKQRLLNQPVRIDKLPINPGCPRETP